MHGQTTITTPQNRWFRLKRQ